MTVENEAALVFIPVGVVAVDFHDFGNEAPSGPPLQMHNDVYGVADVCLDRAIRQVDAALEDATGESSKALLCGGGMDSREASGVSSSHSNAESASMSRLSASFILLSSRSGLIAHS